MINKENISKILFYLIILFSIINLCLKIVDIKSRIPYWNTKDIDSSFISYFKKENSRMGWLNIKEPDYDYTQDVSFYWFRYLLMPTQLDNRKIQDRLIIKFNDFNGLIKFSKDYRYRIIGIVEYFSVAFLEKLK